MFRKDSEKALRQMRLHYESYHTPHVKSSLPYSQFLRLRRINSDYSDFLQQALVERLRSREYTQSVISGAFTRAIKQDRSKLLNKNNRSNKKGDRIMDRDKDTRSTFSFQFNTMSDQIRHTIRKNWHILQSDADLWDKTKQPPIISFRRSKNIRNELVG